MKYRHTLAEVMRRVSPQLRDRGRVLRKFSQQLGLVYFGGVNQHDDDHSAIRGFTASLTHSDTHYSVGTYDGYDIRLVDRLDILHIPGHDNHQQTWTIIEIDLEVGEIPHVFFVPTGEGGSRYARLFATQPYLLPLNSTLATTNKSPEFHGRYQIMARPTHSHQIERIFTSPAIVGLGARFWPYGIEIQHGKLFVYLPQKKLTKTSLETALGASLWLTDLVRHTSTEE
jgi:hypothetical protein